MIEKIESLYVNLEQMKTDYESVLYKVSPNGWDGEELLQQKQIHIRGDHLISPINSELYNPKDENKHLFSLYKFWNKDAPEYTKNILEELSSIMNHKLVRARYICLPPGSGLKAHKDLGIRFHFVLDTNIQSFFSFVNGNDFSKDLEIYHMPCCNHFYLLDTRREHFVYNAGHTNRIHLVIS